MGNKNQLINLVDNILDFCWFPDFVLKFISLVIDGFDDATLNLSNQDFWLFNFFGLDDALNLFVIESENLV